LALWLTVFGVMAALLCVPGPAAADGKAPLATRDPFYRYRGDLGGLAPGTVLKHRAVKITLALDAPTLIPATQLLFRTTDQLGRPSTAVTTAVPGALGSVLPRIVSWQPAYDTLGRQCDPSVALAGKPMPIGPDYFGSCDFQGGLEATLANTFLAQGATVVIPDYEQTTDSFGVGPLEGRATLDSLRAVERFLHYRARTPAVLVGGSGGAIASEWAAELAPRYAPEINLVGTAIDGVMVDPEHNLKYINGNATNSANVIPAVTLSIFKRGFGINISRYLTELGKRLISADRDAYINQFAVTPHLRYQQLFKRRRMLHVPRIAAALDELVMGTGGTPRSPIFMANASGIVNNGYDGDNIMIASDVKALARRYCRRGVRVLYQQYDGLNHVESFAPFLLTAIPYLSARLAGLPARSNCNRLG